MVELAVFLFFLSIILGIFPLLQLAMRKLAFPAQMRHKHIRYILVILLLDIFVFSWLLSTALVEVSASFISMEGVLKLLGLVLPDYSNNLCHILLNTIILNMMMHACTVLLCLAVRFFSPKKTLCFRDPDEYKGWKFPLALTDKLIRLFFDSADGERSTLNSRGHCIGKWICGIKWSFVLLGALELTTMIVAIFFNHKIKGNFTDWSVSWYLLPISGFLLADQVQTALSAPPGFKIDTIDHSKPVCQINPQLDEQIKVYTSTFGDSGALLCSKKLADTQKDIIGIANDLGNQQIADCENGEMLEMLCARISACGEEAPSNHYQRALAELLDGKHINVCDQLEGEFVIYLAAYLNYVLSQGRTAVLLCKSSRDAKRLKEVCRESLYRLNNISSIWNICTAREANSDTPMNLLICSFEELLKLHLLEIRREFADALKCVIVAHGEWLFAQDNIRIKRLFNEIRTYSTKVQYVLLSETDNSSLRTAMECHMDGGELLPFDNVRCKDHTCVMVWREESQFKLQSRIPMGDQNAPYLGTALPLALAAAKCEVPKIHLIPAEDRPDDTYWQRMCSSTLDVQQYLSSPVDPATVIRTDPAEALRPQQLKQLICYDTQYDLINAALGWTQYAGSEGTVLHIVSPHYLLREYFADQFLNDSVNLQDHPVEALIPHGCIMEKSKLAALLVDLWDHGMTENALLQRSKEYGWINKTPEELLEACLRAVLPHGKSIDIYERFTFEQRRRQLHEDGSLVTETFVRLSDAEAYRCIIEQTRPAIAQIGLDRRVELTIPSGDISNYYLREQQLVLDGISYTVDSIVGDTLTLTQTNDPYAYEYFPVSQFDFVDYQIVDQGVDRRRLDINLAVAKTRRDIYAYWKSTCGYRISKDSSFTLENFSDHSEEKTVSVLEITLPSLPNQDPWKVSATLAFILNDLFKTLFPRSHQNLFAVVRGQDTCDELITEITSGKTPDREQIVTSLIPFTRSQTPNNRTASTIYIIEYSCLEYGMIGALYRNRVQILRTVQDYLRWYLTEKTSPDGTVSRCGTELLFGGDTIPSVLAPEALLAVLNKMIGIPSPATPQLPDPVNPGMSFSNVCSFCGRNALVMRQYDDGRKICNICHDHQVTDQDEIRQMLNRVKRFLEEVYGIHSFPSLHIRFKSADEIRHGTDAPGDERRLGFYDWRENRLLLENGGPKVPMCAMLIHELIRSWQYKDLPMLSLKKLPAFCKDTQLLHQLLEGHASLVEVESLRMQDRKVYADRQEQMLLARNDGYGKAYRLIRRKYNEKRSKDSSVNAVSFMKQYAEDLVTQKESLDWNHEEIS